MTELLFLPLGERTRENIVLNIPCLRRKCDLFYHLSDRDAYKLLQKCQVQQFDTDLAIPESDHQLCILLKGKVSLCHKAKSHIDVITIIEEEVLENSDKPDELEKDNKVRKSSTRRKTVVEIVSEFLVKRKASMSVEHRQVSEKKASISARGDHQNQAENFFQMPTRYELYGKSVLQYSEGSYFGGPDMAHKDNGQNSEEYVYVADTSCLVICICEELQETIINAHMLKSIEDKETVLRENHITRKLNRAQRSTLLHEMIEENYIFGNTLVEAGSLCDTVHLIKSGFARLSVVTKKQKCQLDLAIQHLPSTKLQQKLQEISTVIIDIGPGEFVGGFEIMFDCKEYLFTLTAQTDILSYNIRASHFKDVLMKEGSKTFNSLLDDFTMKFQLRKEVGPLEVSPTVMAYVNLLLDGEPEKPFDPADLYINESKSRSSHSGVNHNNSAIMGRKVSSKSSEGQPMTKRIPNRGPFADRVRDRMIELGFKSRRG